MKQLIQSFKTGEMVLEDVPAPIVRSGGLLVATSASVVSAGTEKQIIDLAKKSLLQKAKARPDLVRKVFDKVRADGVLSAVETVRSRLDQPFPLGYSCSGVVLEVGSGVNGLSAGDPVACAGQNYASHAEINFIPENLCVRIPPGVSMESASFVTLGAIALQSVRQAEVRLGEIVSVVGLGLLGQIVVQLLRNSGCVVIGSDLDASRVALAKELGCHYAVIGNPTAAVEAVSSGHGADCTIIAASTTSNDPVELAGEITRIKGKVVVLGAVGMDIPRKSYYQKELDIRLSMSYGPGRYDPNYEEYGHDYPYAYVRWTEKRNMECFLQLLANGSINVQRLITHRFPIGRALSAYELLEDRKPEQFMGIVLEYPETIAKLPVRKIAFNVAVKSSSSSKAVIGVIGAGTFAQGTLLQALADLPGCRLRALADVRGEVARHVARKMNFESCSSDPRNLLADPEINTVFITTRHNSHADLVCEALSAGKHTFVEKPLCMNRQELKNIEAIYRSLESKTLLMVGFNRRFAPLMTEVKKAYTNRQSPLLMTFRINAGALPVNSWIRSTEEGGGRIIGEMCHFIDTLSYLADARIREVDVAAIGASNAAAPREDNIIATIHFNDGSIGAIIYTSMGDRSVSKEYFEVFGGGCAAVLDNFLSLSVARNGKRTMKRALRQRKGHYEEVSAFIHAISEGKPSPIPFDSILETTLTTFRIVELLGEKA